MTELRQELDPCDGELLGRYTSGAAPEAFAELVRRHVDFVYSTARSALHDRHLAEDVTQAVFLLLVRKADSLRDRRNLGGWLFHAAMLESRGVLKKRSREARRIQQLAHQPPHESDPMRPHPWPEIEPHLNAALEALGEAEREAVVLRYFQRRPYDWIATALNVSEPAARQRVHRALDRLRDLLRSRGVTAASAAAPALGATLKAHAVQPAPEGLAAKTIAAADQLSATLASAGKPIATVLRPTLTSKALAALIVGTTTVAVGAVVTLVALHRQGGESVYLDPAPAPNTARADRPVAPPPPAAPIVRPTFHLISAKSYDDHRGTREVGGFIGYINPGDWLRFNRVDLGPADVQPATFTASVTCPDKYAGNRIEIRADDLNGPLLGTLTVKSTGGYGNWRPQSTPLAGATGVHDLFLRFSGGGWNIDTLKITLPRRPGTVIIPAVSFNDAFGVQTRGGVVCETADGHWVRYTGLNFTSPVNALALTYACGSAQPGATIGVHLDRPDGPLVAEMPVQSTGSWGPLATRLLPLSRELAGSHDIVLTFSGKRRGIANLHSFQFLYHAPATLPTTHPVGTPQ
jgi:RNA polymerase sigma factor (sigma-70 family)